ncbi:transcriptional regulator, XRE family [Desulforamulus reducens MI-1]|uniref:Transcriptional regulator, XRE family n=1 Tax=Desulforamulus reducens (strain ATCC BAA-1160 / DSM 100696 / MI-1) TaxID=349161 RepID=A4J893_DESRM|nr:helix-turn-helix transcriptional regulator [Desulforamulus reducens]ABO51296.1 transcriptional regulator, XRE family [Desulforamulus reducens MI-1]
MPTLGQRIKELREKFSLTQKDLALVIGFTSARSIQYIEADKRGLDHNALITLADYFNVSLDYLLGRSDDPTPSQTQSTESAKKLYDVIARAKDLPEQNIEELTDTLDALIGVHLKKLKSKGKKQ